MFRWGRAWAVGCKEMRDLIRDRRTVFMAVVFPLILYPLLIIGIIQATVVQEGEAEKRILTVAVDGIEHARGTVEEIEKDENLRVVECVDGQGRFGARDAVAAIEFPPDWRAKLASGKTARAALFYDSADPDSRAAMEKVARVLDGVNTYLRDRRLERKKLDAEFITPIAVDTVDVATARQRGAFHVGRILAFLLVILCLMGALYPALDAVAGEKERGTLETLLSIPATRLEILAGKYTAVFAMSMTSALSNFVSLSVTFFMVSILLKSHPMDAPIDLTVPLSAFLLFLLAIVPLAAFFSAVTLGVASFARSTREGQYYLGPLYAAVLPLTALALSPGARLTWVSAVAPVLSTALFIKEGLLGTLSAGPALLSLGATCIYAVIALLWAARVFSREEVLFASPAGEPAAAGGVARPGHVVFVWAVSVILFFFFAVPLREKYSPVSPVLGLVVYLGFVAGPALVYAAMWRIDWRRVFPLGGFGVRRLASSFLFVPGAILLAMAAKAVQFWLLPPPARIASGARFEEASVWAVFLTMALLPAVCEELLYRGLIYRSLAARLGQAAGIIISAALFSAAHLNPYEVIPLFVLGAVLALAVRATGALETSMIVHFSNNCFSLLAGLGLIDLAVLRVEVSGVWLAVFVTVCGGAGCVLVWGALAATRRWLR